MRFRILMATGAAIALAVAGCAFGPDVSDAEADAIAAAVAGPSGGFTQEATDIGGLLFGSGSSSGERSMMGPRGTVFPAGAMRFLMAAFPASTGCTTTSRRPPCARGPASMRPSTR